MVQAGDNLGSVSLNCKTPIPFLAQFHFFICLCFLWRFTFCPFDFHKRISHTHKEREKLLLPFCRGSHGTRRRRKHQEERERGWSHALQRNQDEEVGQVGRWDSGTQQAFTDLARLLFHARRGGACLRHRCFLSSGALRPPQLPRPSRRWGSCSRCLRHVCCLHQEEGHRGRRQSRRAPPPATACSRRRRIRRPGRPQ